MMNRFTEQVRSHSLVNLCAPGSQFQRKREGFGLCLLPALALILLFVPVLIWSQAVFPKPTPPAQPEVPEDSLGRTTPRGAVLGFLGASVKGNNELAAQYLNTKLRGKAAAKLAHKLFVVLDRRLPASLNELSDKPEGSLHDPLKPNQNLVGTIDTDNGSVEIFVERVDQVKARPVWLFASRTLELIPDIYEEVNAVSADTTLPDFLVNTRIARIPLFEWLAVLVGMPLFYLLTGLLSRLVGRLLGMLRRRIRNNKDLSDVELLSNPVRLFLLALMIRWLLSKISLPLAARQFWSSTSAVIAIAACVWLMIHLSGWVEKHIQRKLQSHGVAGSAAVVRLLRHGVDVIIIFAGVLVVLYRFGANPTAALAGLGVGGIAVALAAQKTLENVVGGISIIMDQALRTGDVLKLGDGLGTVVDIGLRSTRVRTFDRSIVSIPNGQVANMTLETVSARDKFWFHPGVRLRYETTPSQLLAALNGIRNLLRTDTAVEQDSMRVRLLGFSPSSYEIEVFAYVFARDWVHFLEIQEELLFSVMETIQDAGAQLALPAQTAHLVTDIGTKKSAGVARPRNPGGETATVKPA